MTKRGSGGHETVLDALLQSLDAASVYNANVQVGPAVILWPDQGRQWLPLVSTLRRVLPQFLTLGEFEPEKRCGPPNWIKCMVARCLPEVSWGEDVVPILYLPGISRLELREVEYIPKAIRPLAELQYRGVYWTQQNNRDWTVLAFLKTRNGGLGLDMAQDTGTQQALARALVPLSDTPVQDLRGRRLEAADFDYLLTSDPVRDLLRWLDDPESTRQQWGAQTWGALCSVCQAEYNFDPASDGELIGAERLCRREGKWAAVWDRFAESPRNYPNLPALLGRAEQSAQLDLLADRSTWPGANHKAEKELRAALLACADMPAHDARGILVELENRHGLRRSWVWAELGQAPLAQAMEHLIELAEVTSQAIGGGTPDEMGQVYVGGAWRADLAMWRSLISASQAEDVDAVSSVIRAVYLPWLEQAAQRLQDLVDQHGYPGAAISQQAVRKLEKGECLLFVDGLRLDVGMALRDTLETEGLGVAISHRWQGLPSVTATNKPAVSPVADMVFGMGTGKDFEPSVRESQKPLSPYYFRKLLESRGIQVLDGEDSGDPGGRGWCERGDLDHLGHRKGAKAVRQIPEQLHDVRDRVVSLLDAGWKKVSVVTDHGWLLLPGGLPDEKLPSYLASTRWGRCAMLKLSSQTTGLVVPWMWSAQVNIGLPRGVSCYTKNEYDHGGLSLQECLTAELEVTRAGGQEAAVRIINVAWHGMRCRIQVEGACAGLRVDIRTRAAAPESSLADGGKPLGESGKGSVVVEDDSLEGMAALVVVTTEGGAVLAKATTAIGSEN